MLLYLEITANALNALSIALAALNKRYTWPVGIVGCLLFLVLFMQSQLYADALLQVFFIGTSIAGWRSWTHHAGQAALPVSHVRPRQFVVQVGLACAVCAAYGALLHAYTDAYSPYADSAVRAGIRLELRTARLASLRCALPRALDERAVPDHSPCGAGRRHAA